ncbi:MAG TPA: FUSC family protein [Gaiellaceae bacterium]|nr:FUSC family protein [Gaiellaceae bacterium]
MPGISAGERLRVAVGAGSRTALAVLLAFAAGGALVVGWSLPGRLLVFVVVLAVQLGRRLTGGSLRHQAVGLAALPLVAVATALLGELLLHDRVAGDAAVVLTIYASFSLRRARPWLARSARLLSVPATVLFVAPVPVRAGGSGGVLWYVLLSVVAGGCVVAADRIVGRFVPAARPPALAPGGSERRSSMRPSPTQRIGLHLALGLTLAFALGQTLYPDRYGWMIVSVLAIGSGLRSRGDVLLRGGERLVGALAGTVVATVAAAAIGDDTALAIAVIVVLVVVASLLREVTYVAWAFSVTTMLGLLYGLYGEHGTHLLGERLAENALGALCAIVPSCLLLPVPTAAVVRRRTGDLLRALDWLLVALPEGAYAAAAEAVAEAHLALADATRPLRLLARATRRPPAALALVDAALAEHGAVYALAATGAVDASAAGTLRRRVGALRRELARGSRRTHSDGGDSTAGSQQDVTP